MNTNINKITAAIGSGCMMVIDLETGSIAKDNSAVILSIGVTVVRVPDLTKISRLYINVNPYCDDNVHRSWCKETMSWWEDQNKEALNEAMKQSGTVPLHEALIQLSGYVKEFKKQYEVYPFGNGSEFDLSILVHAFDQVGVELPWKYSNQQSIRTIIWIGRVFFGIDFKGSHVFDGTPHIAIDDSDNEASYTIETLDHIKSFITARPAGDE